VLLHLSCLDRHLGIMVEMMSRVHYIESTSIHASDPFAGSNLRIQVTLRYLMLDGLIKGIGSHCFYVWSTYAILAILYCISSGYYDVLSVARLSPKTLTDVFELVLGDNVFI